MGRTDPSHQLAAPATLLIPIHVDFVFPLEQISKVERGDVHIGQGTFSTHSRPRHFTKLATITLTFGHCNMSSTVYQTRSSTRATAAYRTWRGHFIFALTGKENNMGRDSLPVISHPYLTKGDGAKGHLQLWEQLFSCTDQLPPVLRQASPASKVLTASSACSCGFVEKN